MTSSRQFIVPPQILVFKIRAIVSAGEDRLNISHGIFHGEFAISNDRLV
jgi:hypothetical protein